MLNNLWGSLTIDMFADHENSVTKRLNSKFYVLFTEGNNSFIFHCSNKMNYLVSLDFLIPKVIKHVEKSRCKGALVVPYWPLAASWPFRDQKYVQTLH